MRGRAGGGPRAAGSARTRPAVRPPWPAAGRGGASGLAGPAGREAGRVPACWGAGGRAAGRSPRPGAPRAGLRRSAAAAARPGVGGVGTPSRGSPASLPSRGAICPPSSEHRPQPTPPIGRPCGAEQPGPLHRGAVGQMACGIRAAVAVCFKDTEPHFAVGITLWVFVTCRCTHLVVRLGVCHLPCQFPPLQRFLSTSRSLTRCCKENARHCMSAFIVSGPARVLSVSISTQFHIPAPPPPPRFPLFPSAAVFTWSLEPEL